LDFTEEASPANKKRKFEFDPEAAKQLAQEAEDEAVRQLEIEQVGTSMRHLQIILMRLRTRMMLARPSFQLSGCRP
jgi:hypothetical protein